MRWLLGKAARVCGVLRRVRGALVTTRGCASTIGVHRVPCLWCERLMFGGSCCGRGQMARWAKSTISSCEVTHTEKKRENSTSATHLHGPTHIAINQKCTKWSPTWTLRGCGLTPCPTYFHTATLDTSKRCSCGLSSQRNTAASMACLRRLGEFRATPVSASGRLAMRWLTKLNCCSAGCVCCS